MKTEEASIGNRSKKGTRGLKKRSAPPDELVDNSSTTTGSDGFRSSDQEGGRKKKPPSMQSVEDVKIDARNRSRIRRQKKKEFIDGMQREVLSLSHDNAFLRQQNKVLETLLEEAMEKVAKKELREAQQQLQNKQTTSARLLSLVDRPAYAAFHAPPRSLAQQKNYTVPPSMQSILRQPRNDNTLLRQYLVQDILRNQSRASSSGRGQVFGPGMASAVLINPGMIALNCERSGTSNNGVSLALDHDVTRNSYPKTQLCMRHDHIGVFPNEALSQRDIATTNPTPMSNHVPASAVLDEIIKNEAKNLIQSFSGRLSKRNVGLPFNSSVAPVNLNPLSDSNILLHANPGNNILPRDVNESNAISTFLMNGRNYRGVAAKFDPNASGSMLCADNSATALPYESVENGTSALISGDNDKATSYKPRCSSGSSPRAA
ncbi:hypothetical protein ACHAXS_002935 [Conticribra weissflogii]